MDVKPIENLDDICDNLNRISRCLVQTREVVFKMQKNIELLQNENARLRDENSKLLIDVAFLDKKLPKEPS